MVTVSEHIDTHPMTHLAVSGSAPWMRHSSVCEDIEPDLIGTWQLNCATIAIDCWTQNCVGNASMAWLNRTQSVSKPTCTAYRPAFHYAISALRSRCRCVESGLLSPADHRTTSDPEGSQREMREHYREQRRSIRWSRALIRLQLPNEC